MVTTKVTNYDMRSSRCLWRYISVYDLGKTMKFSLECRNKMLENPPATRVPIRITRGLPVRMTSKEREPQREQQQ